MPLRVALLGVGALIGLWARTVASSSGGFAFATRTSWGLIFLLIVGWSAMVAATIALRERPSSTVLLYLAGILWFVAEAANPSAGAALPFALGVVLSAVGPAVVVHLMLSYPTGRLDTWPSRITVVTGYLVTFGVLGLGSAAVFDPEQMGCIHCPTNPLVIGGDPAIFDQLNLIGVRLGAVWLIAAIAGGLWRMLSTRPGARRTTVVVHVCLLGYVGATAGYYLASFHAGYLGDAQRDMLFWQAQGLSLIAIALAMTGDLWGARRARRSLTRLVVGQGVTAPGGLRDALAGRLHDPGLVIAYPIENGGRYVDAKAHDVVLKAPPDRIVTRLVRGGAELAVLVHRPGILTSRQLIDDLTSSIQLGLATEQLNAEDFAQLAHLRSSGARIVSAGDAERRRIERDLHDGAQQRLVALLMSLKLISSGRPELQTVERELHHAINDLRRFAQGVYPILLKDAGLAVALNGLAESRSLTIRAAPDRRYPDVVESSVYQLVARLSDRGPASVQISEEGNDLVTRVTLLGRPGDLHDLANRARTLDGSFDITDRDGRVTATLTLPLGRR